MLSQAQEPRLEQELEQTPSRVLERRQEQGQEQMPSLALERRLGQELGHWPRVQ